MALLIVFIGIGLVILAPIVIIEMCRLAWPCGSVGPWLHSNTDNVQPERKVCKSCGASWKLVGHIDTLAGDPMEQWERIT
jgi:hypothetical protein